MESREAGSWRSSGVSVGVAHDESVTQWSQTIKQWLLQHPESRTSLNYLYQVLGMPRVNLWLGLLLGEFELEQGEEFYGSDVWIKAQTTQAVPFSAKEV